MALQENYKSFIKVLIITFNLLLKRKAKPRIATCHVICQPVLNILPCMNKFINQNIAILAPDIGAIFYFILRLTLLTPIKHSCA